ncbi:MAG TPA: PGF-CTERM sorting domain-containing protein [Methanocella sp.]|uniref:PGF-CTERM sorting domain-containing protein n=1 Tax=Methanocella sp. TaxID=2052833 RepID=UPI002CEBF542|nr:PGF-CTERM sorting domain-containing protein [Methanocella sp.]HTY91248.1 PGF-CTERM sorting domain-containing protein [Methanocella sp.]
MSMIAVVVPAVADKPIWDPNAHSYPQTVWSDWGKKGSVTGRVTTSVNGTVGIGGAYIAIVNASNTTQEFYNTSSDAYGNYQITGINATYSSVNLTGPDNTAGTYNKGINMYKMYAYKDPYGEGYSNAFGIDADLKSAATTSVVIFTKPARIELKAERSHVVADSGDNIQICAYMYDALGNPVADGYNVNFTIGNATNNSFMQYPAPAYAPNQNGSFYGYMDPNGRNQTVATTDNAGKACLQYGWVDEAYGGNNSTIWAYYADDASVFANIKIYFEAPTASWTGYVVDSYGTGYGGIPVMLHVMGYNGTTPYEIYNMTRTTSSSQPFVGLFAFDYIVLQNAAYGYVDASAQLTDNLTIYGKSNNYSMNRSATSIGSIVLRIPPPDAIKVTAEKDTILVGGQSDWIIAQLYLNGQKYKRANIAVTFDSDNDTVATLPSVKTNITDLNGQAWILLTSNQTVGKVNITGTAQIMYNHNLTDTCTVRVVGWGTVSGIVTDQNKVGIPNANVTLWNIQWNDTTGRWENTNVVDIPENPQFSNDGRTAAVGMYTYYRVPWDFYNVTGEKEGHMWYAIFLMGPVPTDIDKYANATYVPGSEYGTATHNIAIPDYSYIAPVSPTPTPTAVVTTTATAVPPTPTPTAKPTPGFEALFALAGLLGVAYLVARKEN